MIGDIGGLNDGLFLIAYFLLTTYNASMFEHEVGTTLVKFQKTPTNSSHKIQKVSKAELLRITQHFESQQLLQLPAWLTLASKVLCKALFKTDHQSKLKKLERAKQEINRALDIRQILRQQ
jgi:hypothetical protein